MTVAAARIRRPIGPTPLRVGVLGLDGENVYMESPGVSEYRLCVGSSSKSGKEFCG